MAPQARLRLPPELDCLTKGEMTRAIDQANVGAENEKIARLYFVDRLPQVDIAAELYLGRATVQRRLPGILQKIEIASKRLKN